RPRLSFRSVLSGALPLAAQPDGVDRRPQAPHRARLPQGRDRGMNVRLYLAQRLTAAVMVPLVAVHLALIVYATRHGLSAGDVLARTRGSVAWALFYGGFVLAAAIHAPIGIRTVLMEWSPLRGRSAALIASGSGTLLPTRGWR